MTPELLFDYIMAGGTAIMMVLFMAAMMGFFDKGNDR